MTSAFRGLSVLVTGASSGIGAELVRQLSAGGAKVALAARDRDRLETLAGACPTETLVVPTDVSEQRECERAVGQTVERFGGLDVLINNAGLSAHGRFEEISDLSVFERLMRVNYLGAVWCTAYALPYLKASRGRVVAVSSLTGLAGVPNRSAYGATKHAMAGFFDSLRVELAPHGVSVTVIYPGFVESEMAARALMPNGSPSPDGGERRRAGDRMPVDECCRLILSATAARDREVLMTWKGKLSRWLKALSPELVDRIASKAIRPTAS
jgi:NAD(P)-dependent dehydrogenase (short-subunit alcohol dehydrogenase family)